MVTDSKQCTTNTQSTFSNKHNYIDVEGSTREPIPTPPHLDGCRHEEVLLLEPQLLALVRAVIGVQHTGQRLSALLGQNSGHVVACVLVELL